mmetsp:Transcript_6298/g.22731  ORF Transcript_6298/g.22731 Transcript_6298/m.22731 type:complete len:214 (-) Transcript_6298:34-675(-)
MSSARTASKPPRARSSVRFSCALASLEPSTYSVSTSTILPANLRFSVKRIFSWARNRVALLAVSIASFAIARNFSARSFAMSSTSLCLDDALPRLRPAAEPLFVAPSSSSLANARLVHGSSLTCRRRRTSSTLGACEHDANTLSVLVEISRRPSSSSYARKAFAFPALGSSGFAKNVAFDMSDGRSTTSTAKRRAYMTTMKTKATTGARVCEF